jgi:outer membrane immunogenic protein
MKCNIVCGFAITALFFAAPFSAASAADMPLKAPPPPPAPAINWTGLYIGGDVGGLWTSNTANWNPLPTPFDFGTFGTSGSNGGSSLVGGLHAGYDWQFASTWVAGIEGDWSWTRAKGSSSGPWNFDPPPGATPNAFTNMSSTLDWMASIRPRLGYLVLPNLLAYGTGGAAWGKFDYAANNSNGPVPVPYITNAAFSNTTSGYVVGGGLEWAMTNNWLLRGEYLFYRFNNGPSVIAPAVNYPANPSGYTWSGTNVSVARVGLSYKF